MNNKNITHIYMFIFLNFLNIYQDNLYFLIEFFDLT